LPFVGSSGWPIVNAISVRDRNQAFALLYDAVGGPAFGENAPEIVEVEMKARKKARAPRSPRACGLGAILGDGIEPDVQLLGNGCRSPGSC
jgi:hypothetical protein